MTYIPTPAGSGGSTPIAGSSGAITSSMQNGVNSLATQDAAVRRLLEEILLVLRGEWKPKKKRGK